MLTDSLDKLRNHEADEETRVARISTFLESQRQLERVHPLLPHLPAHGPARTGASKSPVLYAAGRRDQCHDFEKNMDLERTAT